MSLISDALSSALTTVADAKGESLSYRASIERAWTALTGFVLDRDDVQLPIFDEGDNAESMVRTGRLAGPIAPALATGYQIRDGSGDVWAVVTAEFDQQQLCAVRLTTLDNAGPNRGGAT